MTINRHKLFLVGCGPGGPEYVTPAAASAVTQARTITGAERLLRLFPECIERQLPLPPAVDPAIEAVEEHLQTGSVAVLVSGDPCLFSLTRAMVAHFGENHCTIIPAVSSLQVAFARLGLDWADARILTAHGRIPDVSTQDLSRSDRIAILGGTQKATSWVSRLAEQLAPEYTLVVCENLTYPEETIREMRPEELRSTELSSLALFILVRRSEYATEKMPPDFS